MSVLELPSQVGYVEEMEGISLRRQRSSFATPIAEHALPDSDRQSRRRAVYFRSSCSPHRLERGFRVAVATFSKMRCSADRRAGSVAKWKLEFRRLRGRAAHKPGPATQ